jgi:rhodanese-related sulfurtransferase
MRNLTPHAVAMSRELLIVDIRPFAERLSELGFIPGSRSVPCETADDVRLALDAEGFTAAGIVLSCSSGRRSGQLLAQLEGSTGYQIHHLEGGLLGWRAEGFPVAIGSIEHVALEEDDARVEDLASFRRMLLACFVAEATELAFDKDLGPFAADPLASLMHCFERSGVPWDERQPRRLYRVVDRASSLFRELGGEPHRIAENVSRMYAILGRISARLDPAL